MAYGARLESVLGESPRGFESPILRLGEGPVTCGNAGGGPFVVGAPEAAGPRWVAVLVAVHRLIRALWHPRHLPGWLLAHHTGVSRAAWLSQLAWNDWSPPQRTDTLGRVSVVRRYFVLAMRDVLPLDQDGWTVRTHTEDCPAPPCNDLRTCCGLHVEFVQRHAEDSGYMNSVLELSGIVDTLTRRSQTDRPALPESPSGLASFVIMSAPVETSEDDAARHQTFVAPFELVQRAVDALRVVTASPIATVTLERLWPTYFVLEQGADGPLNAVDIAVNENGQFFRTTPPATPELLQRANQFVAASFNRDPVENFRYLQLAAENAGLVDGDYAGAVLKAAAAAEVLIKHTAATLIWEVTHHGQGTPPWANLDRPLAAKPARLISSVLAPALRGSWNSQRPDQPIGAWRHSIARVRSRVIHRGHRPTSDEVDDALAALRTLVSHVNDRLAASATNFPRTAVMLAGRHGLEKRGAWGKVRATLEHGSLADWRRDYRAWVEADDTTDPAADDD